MSGAAQVLQRTALHLKLVCIIFVQKPDVQDRNKHSHQHTVTLQGDSIMASALHARTWSQDVINCIFWYEALLGTPGQLGQQQGRRSVVLWLTWADAKYHGQAGLVAAHQSQAVEQPGES